MNGHVPQQATLPAHSAKRIFFLTGEQGVGKSTFLTALIKKFALRSSGFITRKRTADSQAFVYMHSVIDGDIQNLRYTAENCVGVCQPSHPTGFPAVFDSFGTETLRTAVRFILQNTDGIHHFILMDELGTMENNATVFCKEVCDILVDYSVLGVIKPRGTVFLPLLEKIPAAVIYRLTRDNRQELYTKLEHAQSFEEFVGVIP